MAIKGAKKIKYNKSPCGQNHSPNRIENALINIATINNTSTDSIINRLTILDKERNQLIKPKFMFNTGSYFLINEKFRLF